MHGGPPCGAADFGSSPFRYDAAPRMMTQGSGEPAVPPVVGDGRKEFRDEL